MASGLLYLRGKMYNYLITILLLTNVNYCFAQQQAVGNSLSQIKITREYNIGGAIVDVNNHKVANTVVELMLGQGKNARVINTFTTNENGGFAFYPNKKYPFRLLHIRTKHPEYQSTITKARLYTNHCYILYLTIYPKRKSQEHKTQSIDVNNPSNRTFTSDEIEKMPR